MTGTMLMIIKDKTPMIVIIIQLAICNIKSYYRAYPEYTGFEYEESLSASAPNSAATVLIG